MTSCLAFCFVFIALLSCPLAISFFQSMCPPPPRQKKKKFIYKSSPGFEPTTFLIHDLSNWWLRPLDHRGSTIIAIYYLFKDWSQVKGLPYHKLLFSLLTNLQKTKQVLNQIIELSVRNSQWLFAQIFNCLRKISNSFVCVCMCWRLLFGDFLRLTFMVIFVNYFCLQNTY